MKWDFEGDDTNPENLEKELGLSRGDVELVRIHPSGAVEVIIKDSVSTASNKTKTDTWLKARGLGKGKIPTGE